MKPSPKSDSPRVDPQTQNGNREPYQTPEIVYEGTISIRAGSPVGLTDPGNPFGID
jgi:hypothetical protein